MDGESLANALYGSSVPDPLPAVDVKPPAAEQHAADLAERLFGEPKAIEPDPQASDEIAKLRATTERQLYSAQVSFADAIPDELFQSEDADPELAVAAAALTRELAADLGLASTEAKELVTIAKQLRAEPQDATEQQRAASQRLIDANHGDVEAAQKDLDRARRLVQRDPRIAAILSSTKLGNSARVVTMMVERARSERAAGRL